MESRHRYDSVRYGRIAGAAIVSNMYHLEVTGMCWGASVHKLNVAICNTAIRYHQEMVVLKCVHACEHVHAQWNLYNRDDQKWQVASR